MNIDISNNPTLKAIDFGFEVEAFLNSDIGRYLLKRAESEVETAVDELKAIDADNTSGIRKIQNRIRVAEHVLYWLAEAISAGNLAQQELHEQGDN